MPDDEDDNLGGDDPSQPVMDIQKIWEAIRELQMQAEDAATRSPDGGDSMDDADHDAKELLERHDTDRLAFQLEEANRQIALLWAFVHRIHSGSTGGTNAIIWEATSAAGDPGSSSTTCAYTYTIKDLATTATVGSGIGLYNNYRIPNVRYGTGNRAVGYFASDGITPIVVFFNETPGGKNCA